MCTMVLQIRSGMVTVMSAVLGSEEDNDWVNHFWSTESIPLRLTTVRLNIKSWQATGATTGILLEGVWNMLYFVLAKRRFKDVKCYDVASTVNLGELMRMTDVVLLDLNRSTTYNGRCHLATRPGILTTPAFCCFVDFLVGIGQWLLAILGNLESQQ